MKKLVIANSGLEKQGKSSSIREIFNQLRVKYPYNILKDDCDIKATVDINGIIIGIESQGDPNSRMQQSMDEFVKINCQIIVAACRTKRGTLKKINELHTNNGYDIIWASNDRTSTLIKQKKLNEKYAERVIELILDHINVNSF